MNAYPGFSPMERAYRMLGDRGFGTSRLRRRPRGISSAPSNPVPSLPADLDYTNMLGYARTPAGAALLSSLLSFVPWSPSSVTQNPSRTQPPWFSSPGIAPLRNKPSIDNTLWGREYTTQPIKRQL